MFSASQAKGKKGWKTKKQSVQGAKPQTQGLETGGPLILTTVPSPFTTYMWPCHGPGRVLACVLCLLWPGITLRDCAKSASPDQAAMLGRVQTRSTGPGGLLQYQCPTVWRRVGG